MKVKHIKFSKWARQYQGEFQAGEISELADEFCKVLIDNGYAVLFEDKKEDTKAIENIAKNKAIMPEKNKQVFVNEIQETGKGKKVEIKKRGRPKKGE